MKKGYKKEFLKVSKNKSPVRIDLKPQEISFIQSPGKIYPKYIDKVHLENLPKKIVPGQMYLLFYI